MPLNNSTNDFDARAYQNRALNNNAAASRSSSTSDFLLPNFNGEINRGGFIATCSSHHRPFSDSVSNRSNIDYWKRQLNRALDEINRLNGELNQSCQQQHSSHRGNSHRFSADDAGGLFYSQRFAANRLQDGDSFLSENMRLKEELRAIDVDKRRTIEYLESYNDMLRASVTTQEKELSEKSAELSLLREMINRVEIEKAEMAENYDSVMRERKTVLTENDRLERRVEELQLIKSSTSSMLGAANCGDSMLFVKEFEDRIAELTIEVDEATKQRKWAMNEWDKVVEEGTSIRLLLDRIRKEKNALIAERASFMCEMDALKAERKQQSQICSSTSSVASPSINPFHKIRIHRTSSNEFWGFHMQTETVISKVAADSPASSLLNTGDKVLMLDDVWLKNKSPSDIAKLLDSVNDNELSMQIHRGTGQRHTATIDSFNFSDSCVADSEIPKKGKKKRWGFPFASKDAQRGLLTRSSMSDVASSADDEEMVSPWAASSWLPSPSPSPSIHSVDSVIAAAAQNKSTNGATLIPSTYYTLPNRGKPSSSSPLYESLAAVYSNYATLPINNRSPSEKPSLGQQRQITVFDIDRLGRLELIDNANGCVYIARDSPLDDLYSGDHVIRVTDKTTTSINVKSVAQFHAAVSNLAPPLQLVVIQRLQQQPLAPVDRVVTSAPSQSHHQSTTTTTTHNHHNDRFLRFQWPSSATGVRKVEEAFGADVIGGNLCGLFVNEALNASRGFRKGDRLLMLNKVALFERTREDFEMEIRQFIVGEIVTVVVRFDDVAHRRALAMKHCDGFYVRCLRSFSGMADSHLSFEKDAVLYVEDTYPEGRLGTWQAWLLDSRNNRIANGFVPSKSTLEDAASVSTFNGATAAESFRSLSSTRSSFTRSFLKRRSNKRKQQRPISSASTLESIEGFFQQSLSYQRVMQIEVKMPRPVVIWSPIGNIFMAKLITESPDLFSTIEILSQIPTAPSFNSNSDTVEFKVGNCLNSMNVEDLLNVSRAGRHCLLCVPPQGIERLIARKICPIVICIRHKSGKSIKEFCDSLMASSRQAVDTRMKSKEAKDKYDEFVRYENEYELLISETLVFDGCLQSILSKMRHVVFYQQSKVLWLPTPSPSSSHLQHRQ